MIPEPEPLPICPRCGTPMRLYRATQKIGSQPAQHTYRCESCFELLDFLEEG